MLLKSKAVIPEGYEVKGEIGDYTFCEYEDELYMVGAEIIKLDFIISTWVKVLPFVGESLISIIEGGDIPNLFNIEPEKMYYMTMVEDITFLFNELDDAANMMKMFIGLSVVIVNHRRSN